MGQITDTRARVNLAEAKYREALIDSVASVRMLLDIGADNEVLGISIETLSEVTDRLKHRPSAEQVRDALDNSGGAISRAAHALGMDDHNSLAWLIKKKFPELKNRRKPELSPRGLAAKKTRSR